MDGAASPRRAVSGWGERRAEAVEAMVRCPTPRNCLRYSNTKRRQGTRRDLAGRGRRQVLRLVQPAATSCACLRTAPGRLATRRARKSRPLALRHPADSSGTHCDAAGPAASLSSSSRGTAVLLSLGGCAAAVGGGLRYRAAGTALRAGELPAVWAVPMTPVAGVVVAGPAALEVAVNSSSSEPRLLPGAAY